MAEAGMRPLDVLVAATQNAAAVMGSSPEVGTLEKGKAADSESQFGIGGLVIVWALPEGSLGEQLAHVLERLELQRVAARVQQEHGCLLARLALEADCRFHREVRARCDEPVRQILPVLHLKQHAEMRDGHVVREQASDPSRDQAERLPGEVAALLERESVSLQDIDCFAVATGPGSF